MENGCLVAFVVMHRPNTKRDTNNIQRPDEDSERGPDRQAKLRFISQVVRHNDPRSLAPGQRRKKCERSGRPASSAARWLGQSNLHGFLRTNSREPPAKLVGTSGLPGSLPVSVSVPASIR